MICCFTGHRKIPAEQMLKLPELLDRELEKLILCGVHTFRGGGAIGFDTLAELKVIEKKKKYGFIRLELILPCKDQTKNWGSRNKMIYDYVISEADSVEYVSECYNSHCMHERNRRLVNNSDFCVAYCSDTSGGTAYTIDYARSKGVDVINLFDVCENGGRKSQ